MAGTFEPGPRDFDWSTDGRNDAIARNWPAIAAGSHGVLQASVSADFVNLTNAVVGAAGLVLGVVAIVVA